MTYTVPYGSRLTALAACHPDRLAVVHVDPDGHEREVSWQELERRANQAARLLAERRVGRGALVAISLPNTIEHLIATYGAWKLGATVLPMRWSLPAWERTRLLDLARPTVVVSADDDLGDWPLVSPEALEESVGLADGPLPECVADPAQAIATSGSTGSPKLIVAPVPAVVDVDAPPNMGAITGTHILQLVTSPLYHTNGFGCHLRLMAGGRVILMERFDAKRVVDLIRRWQVNHVILVPTMLQRIARLPDLDAVDLASLRYVYYGGAPLARSVAHRWLELVGATNFYFQYGGTEQLGGTMARGDEWLDHEGTVGRPLGCTVRILDENGRELPTGEVGEIFFRPDGGRATFAYVGAPMPKTTNDGFTTYGDLGRLDDDGYLYIVDRRFDMIVSGGANVFPAEVELALGEHPEVADVVVIGLPDEEWGRRVHAVVQPVEPAAPPAFGDLREHCRARLASYKVPKTFELVPTIPRTEAGKVSRSALIASRTSG